MHLMGTVCDMKCHQTQCRKDTEPVQYDINKTHSWIFEDGLINKVLASRSSVPLQSAFSVFSASLPKPLRFNYYCLLGLDMMHEIEVGSWKAILIHLLRILQLLRHITCFN
ncbi:hypothetical protein C8Q72DRAFT_907663 [Fomitopsis betulina]|nr:hypothetical protein C8Q72DRAFT_907663 [Fomitopsis betulina]